MALASGNAESIDSAESLFGERRVLQAELLLRELERECEGQELATVLSDLGVVLSDRGATREAELKLFSALLVDPESESTLRNLAELSEEVGDVVAASYWWGRLLEVTPGAQGAVERLHRLLSDHGRERRSGNGPSSAGAENRADRKLGPMRVLLVVNFFYPSVGGTERLAEQTAVALRAAGISVEIAAAAFRGRTEHEHLGLRIHEIGDDREAGLRRVIAAGDYDAVVIQSDADDWPMLATLAVADSSLRTVAVPCVNAQHYATMERDGSLRDRVVQRLRRADVVCVSSVAGTDQRFAREQGFDAAYVPNATERIEPRPGFRARYGLDAAKPLFLSVGNFWHVKNHLGLLSALATDPGDWQLVIIGSPAGHEPALAQEISAMAATDSRVTLLGGMPPQEVADAMHESDALLLPSLAEATPMVVIEAMSHGLPWVATPQCGAVHDHAGGLIVGLEHFTDAMEFLVDDQEARSSLADAGRRHWARAYTWDVVGPRYAALIRGEAPESTLDQQVLLVATDEVRARFYAGLPERVVGKHGGAVSASSGMPTVTCIMTAFNYEAYVGDALESVLAQTYPESLLDVVVVDDGSTDGTAAVVQRVAAESGGRVTLVQRQNGGLVAATNTALEHARGELIGICDADDCWLPDRIEAGVELFRRDAGVRLVYADMQVIDPAGVVEASSFFAKHELTPLSGMILDQLCQLNFTTNSTLLFRAADVPRLPDGLPFADYWIATNAAAAGKVALINRPLAQYRLHGDNMSFGAAEAAKVVKVVRWEIAQRRRMLAGNLSRSVSAPALARVAFNFDREAQSAFQACGTVFVDLVDVTEEDRDRSAQMMREAAAAGDADAELRAYALALLSDPFNRDARSAIVRIASGVQN